MTQLIADSLSRLLGAKAHLDIFAGQCAGFFFAWRNQWKKKSSLVKRLPHI